jgi:hypothetical protein
MFMQLMKASDTVAIRIIVQVLQLFKNSFPELPVMLIYISGFNGRECIIEYIFMDKSSSNLLVSFI